LTPSEASAVSTLATKASSALVGVSLAT
jgi:hypothetical protein